MQVGIVGLPNVGKTTLFNALTKAGAEIGAYPFTTKSSNVGVAEVPDQRLHKVAELTKCERIVPTTVKFLDVAGLVRGASKGEGLGNQFLGLIRDTDAILHVVRCFADENISHVDGSVNPLRDIETVNLELALADLATLERVKEKAEKSAKSGDKESKHQLEVLEKAESSLNQGSPLRLLGLEEEAKRTLSSYALLTLKPLIYIANISEADVGKDDNSLVEEVKAIAAKEQAEVLVVSAEIEEEISELEPSEAKAFLDDLGLAESSLVSLAKTSYKTLDLITFFSYESSECRAWTIKQGTKAPEAAGKIHTDMEKGFVKAEVVSYDDLVKAGSIHQAREQGHLLLEGREYTVHDGDVIYFKFTS